MLAVAGLIAVQAASLLEAQQVKPAADAKQVAIPASDPRSWMTPADYPDLAMRDGRGGSVSFTLQVRVDGSVASCKVTESSGSPDLDQQTCRLLMQRARFHPARDSNGNAIAGEYKSRMHWKSGYEPAYIDYQFVKRLEPSVRVLTYTVEADGSIHSCFETQDGAPVPIHQTKSPCNFRGKTKPYLDAAGKPVRKVVTQRYTIEVNDPPVPTPNVFDR